MGEQKQIYSANQHIHQIENVKGDSVLDGFNFYKAAWSTLERNGRGFIVVVSESSSGEEQ